MAKNVEIKGKKKKQKRKDFTPFIIIGVLALVVLAVIILTTYKPPIKIVDPAFHTASITDGLTMGDPDAPIKVVEYADYQCPGCGYYWSDMEPTMVSQYIETGKVFYTYVPFSFVGEFVQNNPWDESKKSAEAAFCANDQGKFWEYRDYIFANQNGENGGVYTHDVLLKFAEKLSLDMTTFTECFDSGKHTQTVLDSNAQATAAGITSTPSFTVNGELVNSADIFTTIDAALQ